MLVAGNQIGLLRGFDAAGNGGKVAAGWQGVRTVRSGLRQKFYPSPLLLSLGRQKARPDPTPHGKRRRCSDSCSAVEQ
jgi:hypothetical protein